MNTTPITRPQWKRAASLRTRVTRRSRSDTRERFARRLEAIASKPGPSPWAEIEITEE